MTALKGPFTNTKPIILASGSPRRREMFENLGINFKVIKAPDEVEPSPIPGENPDRFAEKASLAKAQAIHAEHPESVVIGSDTIVVLGNEIMGKPKNDDDAMLMLSKLAGNTHRVVSGCAICHPDGESEVFSVSTDVTMGEHSLEALYAYIRTGEPSDKAGAYAIQGIGGFLVESISGSYNNVVGMPLAKLLEVLTAKGFVIPRKS